MAYNTDFGGLDDPLCERCHSNRDTVTVQIDGVSHELCRHCATSHHCRRCQR